MMNILKIKTINQLYEEYKILFLREIKRNKFTKDIFEYLQHKYRFIKGASDSNFYIIETIGNKYNFDLNINIFNVQYGLKVIQEYYKIDEDNLVEKIKIIMYKTGTSKFDHQTRTELKLLLAINFKN
jgi:hypothetical protein